MVVPALYKMKSIMRERTQRKMRLVFVALANTLGSTGAQGASTGIYLGAQQTTPR